MVLGLVAIPVGYLLAASFTLFALNFVKDIRQSLLAWRRLVYPLWFFGGAQYPWYVLNNISKEFSYFVLLNPFIYAQEGLHAALLGQDEYLSFLVCLASVWFFIFVFGYFGIKKLIKRLDAI